MEQNHCTCNDKLMLSAAEHPLSYRRSSHGFCIFFVSLLPSKAPSSFPDRILEGQGAALWEGLPVFYLVEWDLLAHREVKCFERDH